MITCIGFGLIILLLILKGMTELALYFAIAFGIIILLPIDGYEKTSVETDLEPLRRDRNSDKKYYIETCLKQVCYAYNNNEAYGMSGLAYEEVRVRGNIKIYEDPNCRAPYLKKCITKPKRFYMTFAPFGKKVEYIFYIPQGAVYAEDKAIKDDKTKIDVSYN